MSERTVEQMCRDLLGIACGDGIVTLKDYAPTSGDLAGMANELAKILEQTQTSKSMEKRMDAQSGIARLRKDAESPTTFLLEHPDGRLCVAFGLTATEAVLSIGADANPDEWVICDEKKAGRPMRVPL